jgi:hypothetical protein
VRDREEEHLIGKKWARQEQATKRNGLLDSVKVMTKE